MNTKQIGDEFEDRIFKFLSDELKSGNFGLDAELCKIFRQKGYYSRDREKEIVFDISIEVYRPNQIDFWLLILIECKNYSNAVSVDNIEEFFAKIEQIGSANTKGVFASSSALQMSALNYAISKRIGLLRYFDNRELKWELQRAPSFAFSNKIPSLNSTEVTVALLNSRYVANQFNIYARFGDFFTNSLPSLIFNLLEQKENEKVSTDHYRFSIDYLKKEEIEEFSELVLRKVEYVSGEVSLEKICSLEQEINSLVVRKNVLPKPRDIELGILGRISFRTKEICIFDYPSSRKSRRRFTLAHELGHYFLKHDKYILEEYQTETDWDSLDSINLTSKEIASLEWQANTFAANLLLPSKDFKENVHKLAALNGMHDRGFGLIYLDDQNCNREMYKIITDSLMETYSVSRSAIHKRLLDFGLLNDKRRSMISTAFKVSDLL